MVPSKKVTVLNMVMELLPQPDLHHPGVHGPPEDDCPLDGLTNPTAVEGSLDSIGPPEEGELSPP